MLYVLLFRIVWNFSNFFLLARVLFASSRRLASRLIVLSFWILELMFQLFFYLDTFRSSDEFYGQVSQLEKLSRWKVCTAISILNSNIFDLLLRRSKNSVSKAGTELKEGNGAPTRVLAVLGIKKIGKHHCLQGLEPSVVSRRCPANRGGDWGRLEKNSTCMQRRLLNKKI